jgi:hypothetical protein
VRRAVATLVVVVALGALSAACGSSSVLPDETRKSFAEARRQFDRGNQTRGCAALREGFGGPLDLASLGLRGARLIKVEMVLQQMGELSMMCGDGADVADRYAGLHDELIAETERRATWTTYAKWLGIVLLVFMTGFFLRRMRQSRW